LSPITQAAKTAPREHTVSKMKLLIPVLLIFAGSLSSIAQSQPSPTRSGGKLDSKIRKEIAEMEKQLELAMEKRDGAALEKILADHYFDAYSDERALSRADTIARCKAGKLSFVNIERELEVSPNVEGITVEGLSKYNPPEVDDRTPDEQWIRVRRLWEKKDGRWVLASQVTGRADEDDKEGKGK
jgi:hypothetical protein